MSAEDRKISAILR